MSFSLALHSDGDKTIDRLRVGEDSIGFCGDLELMSVDHYREYWIDACERLLNGKKITMIVTSISRMSSDLFEGILVYGLVIYITNNALDITFLSIGLSEHTEPPQLSVIEDQLNDIFFGESWPIEVDPWEINHWQVELSDLQGFYALLQKGNP